jgi:hypothetical protein
MDVGVKHSAAPHILGFEPEGRRSPDKAGMGGRIHHRQEIFCGQRKSRACDPALLLRTSITASGRAVEAEEWATPLSRWF